MEHLYTKGIALKQQNKPVQIDARSAAYTVLEQFYLKKTSLDQAVNDVFTAYKMSKKDRALAYEIINGTIQRQIYLDRVMSRFLNSKFDSEEKLHLIIRIALYQMLYLDRVPNYSAVDEAVKLTKKVCSFGLSRVVNGVLRNIEKESRSQRSKKAAPEVILDPTERMAVKYSHPTQLVEHWEKTLGKVKTAKLLKFNNTRPDIYVRRNMSLTNENSFRSAIATEVQNTRGMGFKNLYFKLKAGVKPGEMDLFTAGHCTVQAPSSGWVVALLNVNAGDRVYDVCAAPGGKTTLMADLVTETGGIVSQDRNWQKIMRIRENAKRLRYRHIFTFAADARLSPPLRDRFSRVLADVPCSGTGVMHRYADSRVFKGVDDFKKLAQTQQEIVQA
ncbi:MAG: transcription antitermination factor NusB, partial [Fibrobacterota bacterium]